MPRAGSNIATLLRRMVALAALLGTLVVPATAADSIGPGLQRDFIGKVQPFLTKYCGACHGAEKQEGKRFALGRLLMLLTPIRDRGPLRTHYLGKPHGDRASFYCSELVLESCVAAGLLDRATTRPSASFPHDLFFDQSYNPYISKHLPLVHDWEPPARWVDRVIK